MRLATIAAYAVLAPIYWFPGIPYQWISQTKLVLAAILVLTALPTALRAGRPIIALYVRLGLCTFGTLVAISGTSSTAEALERARDFLQPLLWIVVINSINLYYRHRFVNLLRFFLTIFFLIFLYPLGARIGIFPTIAVPAGLIALYGNQLSYLVGMLTVSNAGFNTGSTGWGPAIASGSLMLAAILFHHRQGTTARWQAFAVLALGLIAIVAVEARGASLMMVVSCGLWGLSSARSRLLALLGLIAAISAAFLIDWQSILPGRFLREASGNDLFSRLDSFSTGRFSTYVAGFKSFAVSPLVGVGIEAARVELHGGIDVVTIHNIWLRAAAEGGLLMLLPVLSATFLIVRFLVKSAPRNVAGAAQTKAAIPDFRPVIMFGLLLGLTEPGVIFGPFNNNVLFWTATGLMMARRCQATSRFTS